VRHLNTVFHDVLKLIPWAGFDKLVSEHRADELVRRLTTRQQFVALLFGQLSGASSLRELTTTMESHRGRLYHCGATAPKRSTLADANRKRSSTVFAKLFETMLASQKRGLRRKMAEAVRLIDSTSLRLAGAGARWARFSAEVCGAKAHIVFDPDAAVPVYHEVSAANVNDVSVAKPMPIEAGATYVFDLGYYDYGWWAELDAAGCRIVTRFKKNTPLRDVRSQARPPKGCDILSDRIGFLPERQARSRRNPMREAVREIVVRGRSGKPLRLLTNDLDAPAREIADLYRRRWDIELFFRLMKQTLRITKFLGRSENAVRIQIAVALIVYLLLSALRKTCDVETSHLQLVRLVRANLMHRKAAARLKPERPKPPLDTRQLMLSFEYA
jgi:IS4 transposase